jgi:predicted ester cyclase
MLMLGGNLGARPNPPNRGSKAEASTPAAAFSTATFEQERLLIDGQTTALLLHVHGTNSGEVMGLPPTERPFSVSMVSLCELRDGFIAHERRIYDFTGLLLQVGALKAKPI